MNNAMGNRFSQHNFALTPSANTPRSKFDRSFGAKDTANFDLLTPFFTEEVLPGDTVNLDVQAFFRLASQIKPVMDRMFVDFYFFSVPNRLVWDNFQRQMGEQDNPGDSIDYLTPILDTGTATFPIGSLYDHMGLPALEQFYDAPVISLPMRGYNLVWNQWFRDQNLQNSVTVPKGNGPDPISNYTMLKAAKKHDYFTSALRFSQKGVTPVSIPIIGTAPIVPDNTNEPVIFSSTVDGLRNIQFNSTGNAITYTGSPITTSNAFWPSDTGLVAQFGLSDDIQITINAFRQAMQMQTFLERDARGGTRYVEILKSHFNVISPDARLQRTEFLSGGSIEIGQHTVPQTSETGDTPQGNLSAFSTAQAGGSQIGFNKSFVEHGWVIGLFRARAEITYQGGLDRQWTRRTRYDYLWPEFQELGEQAILNREISLGFPGTNNDVWGYQERYAEYRYRKSEIRGQFRSIYGNSLDVWHLAQDFATAPNLNADFIQSDTPIERILALTDDENYPNLLCDFFFKFKHVRPLITYPTPAGLGRF